MPSGRRERRAGKQKDQHLLTFVCLLMCCGPPVLVVGGVMIYQWAVIRAGHSEMIDTFNDAVHEWNQPSRTHAAFLKASFTVALAEGSTPRLVDHLPAVLRMTTSPEPRPIFAGLETLAQFAPLRYELVLPGQTNLSGIAITRVFDESLRMGLSLYSTVDDEAGVQHSTLVAEVPAFHVFRVHEAPTTALKCRHSFGAYNYAGGICTQRQVAALVCIKVALAGVGSAAHWAPSSDGGGIGCDARDDWAPVRYEGVYTGVNDGKLIEHIMPVVVRNAGSPYILASELTDGSLNFENSRTDKFALGVTLAIVGCGMSYPWIVMCKRKKNKGSRQHEEACEESESESEQRDLLSGRLSSDDEEESGARSGLDRDREGWRGRIRGRGRKARQAAYLSRESAAVRSPQHIHLCCCRCRPLITIEMSCCSVIGAVRRGRRLQRG